MKYQYAKKALFCKCTGSAFLAAGIHCIEFSWSGPAPRAGQFFIIKPARSGVFLGRPISVAAWKAGSDAEGTSGKLSFIVTARGRGSRELADLKPGEEAELIGPLGNSWADAAQSLQAGLSLNSALPPQARLPSQAVPPLQTVSADKPLALVAGGVGIAPLLAFIQELSTRTIGKTVSAPEKLVSFDLYAGFRTMTESEWRSFLRAGSFSPENAEPRKLLVATEDGSLGVKGRIPDFFEPGDYGAVFACGPEPMIKVICAKCIAADVPCFVSMEKHMACGVGACLGCRVKTIGGNLSCCTDGPIFSAGELRFDE